MLIIRLKGKAHQVFPMIKLLAKHHGSQTLIQIRKEGLKNVR